VSQASPIDELRKEHQLFLTDISEVHTMIQGLGSSPEDAREAFGGMLGARIDIFRQGILTHFRREEECLYPDARLFVSQAAGTAGRPDILGHFLDSEAEDDVRAHQVIAARTDEIAALVAAAREKGQLPAQSLAHLRTLLGLTRSLLQRHAEKEDGMIFPFIERSLSPDQLAAVGERLRAFRGIADLTGSDDLSGLGAAEG